MQQNQTDMITVMPSVLAQLKDVAIDMNTKGDNEREVIISGTSVKLWLVRSGTPEAQKRKEQTASILTDDSILVVGNDRFFMARR